MSTSGGKHRTDEQGVETRVQKRRRLEREQAESAAEKEQAESAAEKEQAESAAETETGGGSWEPLKTEIDKAKDLLGSLGAEFLSKLVNEEERNGFNFQLGNDPVPGEEKEVPPPNEPPDRSGEQGKQGNDNEDKWEKPLAAKDFLLHIVDSVLKACQNEVEATSPATAPKRPAASAPAPAASSTTESTPAAASTSSETPPARAQPSAADESPAEVVSNLTETGFPEQKVAAAAAADQTQLWRDMQIECENGKGDSVTYKGRYESHAEMKERIEKTPVPDKGYIYIKLEFKDKVERYRGASTYKASEVNRFLGLIKGDLDDLEEFLKKKRIPLAKAEPKKNKLQQQLDHPGAAVSAIDADLAFVEVENDEVINQWQVETQHDKNFATLVVGESGSGKSTYSCLKPAKKGYTVLYSLITAGDMNPRFEQDFPHLEAFLRRLINKYESVEAEKMGWTAEVKEKNIEALCDMKARINVERNKWAMEVLKTVLHRTFGVKSSSITDPSMKNAHLWFHKKWDADRRPEKVAIVVDEATDPDLAEGLVACVKEIRTQYLHLAQKDVKIVIVGTGLDGLRYPGRLGTNPKHSKVVFLKQPNLDAMVNKSVLIKEEVTAIKSGVFSSIMMTNARMMFRSVLPILTDPKHTVDDEQLPIETLLTRYAKRLKGLGSCRDLMDHGSRFFVNQNSVGQVPGNTRSDLLQRAFLYQLSEAIKNLDATNPKVLKNKENELDAVKKLLQPDKLEDDPKNNIFARGLAMRDTKKTSAALKFLACYGLTCQIRPEFGAEFEELTALHCLRLMECEGYSTVERMSLKFAWPPKANKGNKHKIEKRDVEMLRQKFKIQAKKELNDKVFPECRRYGIVFSQGKPTAQGGDVLVLRVFSSEDGTVVGTLEVIQCKHFRGTTVKDDWWLSLGIDFGTGTVNMTPDNGKAGHSYAGLDEFRSFLQEKLKIPVTLGKRTMAVSFPSPLGGEPTFPDDKDVRIWYREMLEPTFSTFGLKEAEVEEDELDEGTEDELDDDDGPDGRQAMIGSE